MERSLFQSRFPLTDNPLEREICLSILYPCFSLTENSQLDDLYTRYRQRLRKSLFISGLGISLISCIVSIILCCIGSQVNILINYEKVLSLGEQRNIRLGFSFEQTYYVTIFPHIFPISISN